MIFLQVLIDAETSKDYIEALGSEADIYEVSELAMQETYPEGKLLELSESAGIQPVDTKMVIFTSGTTGQPKGVDSSFAAYDCNRQTFESFLQLEVGLNT